MFRPHKVQHWCRQNAAGQRGDGSGGGLRSKHKRRHAHLDLLLVVVVAWPAGRLACLLSLALPYCDYL